MPRVNMDAVSVLYKVLLIFALRVDGRGPLLGLVAAAQREPGAGEGCAEGCNCELLLIRQLPCISRRPDQFEFASFSSFCNGCHACTERQKLYGAAPNLGATFATGPRTTCDPT